MKKYDSKKIKGSKFYKKKVDYMEKTMNNKGEIVEAKEKAHYVEVNANFLKFFNVDVEKTRHLSKHALQLLFVVLDNVNYGNDVFLKDLQRVKIFSKNNNKHISSKLSELFKQNILYKTELAGLYKLNHTIAFKGDTIAYKKLLGIDTSVGKSLKVNG